LQHKPQPVIRVPAECENGDLLLAAKDPTGDGFRHAGNHVAVEADNAVARREFPSTNAAVLEAERVIDLGPAPGSFLGILGDRLAGQDPAALDIAPVKAEPGCGHVGQFRLRPPDLVVLALQQEVTPADPELAAVSAGAPRGQRAGSGRCRREPNRTRYASCGHAGDVKGFYPLHGESGDQRRRRRADRPRANKPVALGR